MQLVFQREGSIWAILIILALCLVGIFVSGGNPVGAIMGALIGILASLAMHLIAASVGVVVGFIFLVGLVTWMMST